MRITQGMMSNNMLTNLTKSYANLNKYMDQLNTGKKINKPSESPFVAIKSLDYRTQLAQAEQFKENASEMHLWMDNSDSALDSTTKALQRLQDLARKAANGTNSQSERDNIAVEAEQIKQDLISIANTKVNDRYIFNGTDTKNPLVNSNGELLYTGKFYIDMENGALLKENGTLVLESGKFTKDENGFITDESGKYLTATGGWEDKTNDEIPPTAVQMNQKPVKIHISENIELQANVNGEKVFGEDFFININKLITGLKDNDQKAIDEGIGTIGENINQVVNERANLGARMNRLDLVENRLANQAISAENIMSKNENVDYEKAITDLLTQETMHRAALSAGARIMQPSLVDFLR